MTHDTIVSTQKNTVFVEMQRHLRTRANRMKNMLPQKIVAMIHPKSRPLYVMWYFGILLVWVA